MQKFVLYILLTFNIPLHFLWYQSPLSPLKSLFSVPNKANINRKRI